MDNFISAAIFYLFVLLYGASLNKQVGFSKNFIQSPIIRFYLVAALFFFANINILFFCAYCDHCYPVCLPLTSLAVLLGALIYLSHLLEQTISCVRELFATGKFEPMGPFLSLPYFYLINEIIDAVTTSGFTSLHGLENKMLIVLAYPFFVLLSEMKSTVKKNV